MKMCDSLTRFARVVDREAHIGHGGAIVSPPPRAAGEGKGKGTGGSDLKLSEMRMLQVLAVGLNP